MQKSVVQRVCCTKNKMRYFSCKNVKTEVKIQDLQNRSRLLSVTDDIIGFFFLSLVSLSSWCVSSSALSTEVKWNRIVCASR